MNTSQLSGLVAQNYIIVGCRISCEGFENELAIVSGASSQQRIGFCTTVDGARIANGGRRPRPYASLRSAHVISDWEWQEPRVRDFWEAIGCHHLVVRYDKHSCGFPIGTDFSLDSEVQPSKLSNFATADTFGLS